MRSRRLNIGARARRRLIPGVTGGPSRPARCFNLGALLGGSVRKNSATCRPGQKTGAKKKSSTGPPPWWKRWDGASPSRAFWGPRVSKVTQAPIVPDPPAAPTLQRQRLPPPVGRRMSIGQHPVYRERWLALKQRVSTIVPDVELDRVADVLLTTEIGHAAMIRRAREGDRLFSSADVDETGKALEKPANLERVTASRLRAATRERRRKRVSELTAQLLEARRQHFSAAGLHDAAMDRFNATWTESDEPSRQRTREERGPLAYIARLLMV
jgi:hypothetical protein